VTRVGGEYGPSPKPEPRRPRPRRRDDSAWREECLGRRGRYCRACPSALQVPGVVVGNKIAGFRGMPIPLEIDHVWPRSQGGPSVLENGLVLCRKHHGEKTAGRLRIEPGWLDADQVAWLADVGWVEWQADGQPRGRGWRHFEARGGSAWPRTTAT
jgi:hypothetical protein